MPSGKKLRSTKPEIETADPAEDAVDSEKPSATVEETTPEPEPQSPPAGDETPTGTERRRGFLRRRKKTAVVEAAATSAGPAEETVADDAPVEASADESQTPGAADEASVEPGDSETVEQETVLVPHRPAGRRLTIAAAAAAALFVAGGAFLGATAQPVIANTALVETKLDIAKTAADAITTLWSYTPENMDSLGARSARYLTGDFAFQYKKFIDSIVATNKQAQVTNTTTVLGTAVESVTPTDASAIVYTNSIATSPVSKNIPSLRYLSYRLEMKRDHADWRITRMTTVTTLDLTPQL
jgi:Mce-associated membrane protein